MRGIISPPKLSYRRKSINNDRISLVDKTKNYLEENKMKKALGFLKGAGLFFAGFIVGGMMLSGGDDDSSKITSEKAAVETAAPVKEEAKQEAPKQEAPKEKAPQQIYSDSRVTISFKEFLPNEGVKLLVENKTNATITIQADSIAINGFSSNDIMMSDDISPKSKGYALVATNELSDAGEAKTLSGGLSIIDFDESFDTYSVNFNNVKLK